MTTRTTFPTISSSFFWLIYLLIWTQVAWVYVYILVVSYYWLGVLRLDKDCELHKISVFDGYLQARIDAQFTFLAGGLIGILVLVFSLFYEGVFDVFGGRFLRIIPFAIIVVGIFFAFTRILQSIKDQQIKYLSLVFELIYKVEKGESIPLLSELKKEVN